MTYKEYIDKLNRLYAIYHQSVLLLVQTENDNTFPTLEIYYDNEDTVERINVAEEVEKLGHEIFYLVSAASKEPWYQMHCNRHDQSVEILTNGVPAGVLAEKPERSFKDFNF